MKTEQIKRLTQGLMERCYGKGQWGQGRAYARKLIRFRDSLDMSG